VEHLETLPWVVTFHGPTAATPASRQMRMRGIEPNVQVITESFLTVSGLVAGSQRIALMQRRLVEFLPLNLGIRALPPPVEVGQLVDAMWLASGLRRRPRARLPPGRRRPGRPASSGGQRHRRAMNVADVSPYRFGQPVYASAR